MNKTEQEQFEKLVYEVADSITDRYGMVAEIGNIYFKKGIKPLQDFTDQLLEKRMGEVSKLQCIFRAINSYEPDGEVNTLCEQAYPIINSIFTPPTDITNKPQ